MPGHLRGSGVAGPQLRVRALRLAQVAGVQQRVDLARLEEVEVEQAGEIGSALPLRDQQYARVGGQGRRATSENSAIAVPARPPGTEPTPKAASAPEPRQAAPVMSVSSTSRTLDLNQA
ncbi:hypothetical protein [Streptomyces buecherae]|uniref:hypothetical protein n=1 Tax=Streptomyces buecherae TaxID=2763006 RepID=UPI001E65CE0D|nr:hypothetical protein [Streptomyces buecherae]